MLLLLLHVLSALCWLLVAGIDSIRNELMKASDNMVKNDLLLRLIDASKPISAVGKLPPASLTGLLKWCMLRLCSALSDVIRVPASDCCSWTRSRPSARRRSA